MLKPLTVFFLPWFFLPSSHLPSIFQTHRPDPYRRIWCSMGHQRPPKLPTQLPQSSQLTSITHERNQAPGLARECLARGAPLRPVDGAVLCPPDRAAQPGRPKLIGLEHLLDENPNRAFEGVQHVVKGHNRMRHEMAVEQLEVACCAAVGVIAVDPEKPNGAMPVRRQVTRVRAVSLDDRAHA